MGDGGGADGNLATLMKNAFQDEALRRMARKAGVHGMSKKDGDDVNAACLGIKSWTRFVKSWLCTLNTENQKLFQRRISEMRVTSST